MNDGVAIVLKRMETHPEEFYGDSDKWKFIYKEYFRDAMTEEEKGAIFDRIKQIRKDEFTLAVMQTLTVDEEGYEHEKNNPAFGYATPNKKKLTRLNAQQMAMASNYANKNGMTISDAIKQLGY